MKRNNSDLIRTKRKKKLAEIYSWRYVDVIVPENLFPREKYRSIYTKISLFDKKFFITLIERLFATFFNISSSLISYYFFYKNLDFIFT